ncbi:hypothetical protein QR680_003173 [Steinernema hermaphroditum]|uniref:Potassium channel domain-containing protein n=1 Tax=Steinernema hermaphroditum TaxID=289476 RepID=A0AA39LJK7_9BILA|nr:hypothetical protein QR680_003173 [Steinernema hermaphroditum]
MSRKRDESYFDKITPYVVHLLVIVAVVFYVIGGAYIIRYIEAKEKHSHSTSPTHFNKSVPAHHLRVNHTSARTTSPSHALVTNDRRQTMHRNRRCVIAALHKINEVTKCDSNALDKLIMKHVDDCYLEDLREIRKRAERASQLGDTGQQQFDEQPARATMTQDAVTNKQQHQLMHSRELEMWTYMDSVVFCFTVITTIGYGNVAPQTTSGRIFVIIYGSLGVPLAMLAIANLGKFLATLLKQWSKPFLLYGKKCAKRLRKSRKANSSNKVVLVNGNNACKHDVDLDSSYSPEDGVLPECLEEDEESVNDEFILLIAFFVYIMAGSFIISSYEPNMNFFQAVYFNFVTLTTIGLGDLVPQSEAYLFFTLIYIAVGLALSTIGIEIAADYLKKLHYFGRKIEDASKVQIWFGGKKLTMKQLVKNLGDQFNLPVEDIEDLNLDSFVDQAIKVEAGELPTLRQPTPDPMLKPIYAGEFTYDSESVVFADEDDLLTLQSYPSPSLLANRASSRNVSTHMLVSELVVLLPPPPFPDEEFGDAVTVDGSSVHLFGDVHIQERRESFMSDYSLAPERQRSVSPYRSKPKKFKSVIPKAPSTDYLSARRNYSEEARKRYQEYQEQWKKFRTTQNPK